MKLEVFGVAKKGPSLRGQWFGQQLRELREAAGFKLKEAGEHIQREQSTLSRMEAGFVPTRVPDLHALLNLYGVDDERLRDALEKLSRDVWRKGWWEGYADHIAEWFIDHAWLEDRAQEIRTFDALVLPGLLQTPDYAETVTRAADPDLPEERIDQGVDFRLRRQQVLDKDEPPKLSVILDEALLYRPAGGPEVMWAQLRDLKERAGRPNIEVRVLPFAAGAHASPDGCFKVFEMAEPFPPVAYATTPAGAVYVEADAVNRFTSAYDRLKQAALDPAESLARIEAAAQSL